MLIYLMIQKLSIKSSFQKLFEIGSGQTNTPLSLYQFVKFASDTSPYIKLFHKGLQLSQI